MPQNIKAQTTIYDIIVVGAGIAGLKAAHDIQKQGLSVLVLEANDRIGGRIQTTTDFDKDFPVDLGAELIHTKTSSTWELIRQQNLKTIKIDNSNDQFKPEEFVDFFNGISTSQIPSPKEKESMDEFLKRIETPLEIVEEVKSIVELDMEELEKVNAQALLERVKYSIDEGELYGLNDFKIFGGYNQIYRILTKDIDIKTKNVVKRVNWENETIKIETKNNQEYLCKKVVLTIPVALLQKQTINFVPELPKSKIEAINDFGITDIIKIFLKFDQKILPKGVNEISNPKDEIPVWWNGTLTADDFYNGQILVGWVAGGKARKLYQYCDEEIAVIATKDLGKKLKIKNLVASKYLVKIWKNEEFAGGVYTYIPKNSSINIIQKLAKPVDNKLFWAGEATNIQNSTVQGAYNSGKRVAEEILNSGGLVLPDQKTV
jgi:monoamine oxidase